MSLFAKPPLSHCLSLGIGSFALLPMLAYADTPAGQVMFVHGSATIERNGERIAAERGADFFAGDTFHTEGASTLQLRYSDGGTKAIRPDSSYTLERYELDDDSPEDSAQGGELVRGGLRAITGAIGRDAPDNVTNSTPVATMAIIFGWIPSFLFIAMTRMQTEFVIALIRTSENSASIRKRLR